MEKVVRWKLFTGLDRARFLWLFVFLRQRETEHKPGRGRERGRHRLSRLRAVSTEPDAGLELTKL